MRISNEYIIFSSAISSFAIKKYRAGIGHEEAQPFVRSIFENYKDAGLPVPNVSWIDLIPASVVKWMGSVLDGKFVYASAPPTWVGEATWRFIGSCPMVFVGQVEAENSDDDVLSAGDVFYIFVGKLEAQDGWIRVTKMISQSKTSSGTEYIF